MSVFVSYRSHHVTRRILLGQKQRGSWTPTARLSSSSTDDAVESVELLQGRDSESLGEIVRHGPGDACITLNVGGKEFYTLRSTVNSNSVLADHVARAEANKEITKNGAVFIDRDPDHFCFILRHLRNRMELSTARHFDKAFLTKFTKAYVELPKDQRALRELYVEAAFYRIPELQSALCEKSLMAKVASVFNKHGNPFDAASKLLTQLRNAVLAAGTVGGTMFMSKSDDWDLILQKMRIREKTKEESAHVVLDG